ncbi:MAG: hypothetical protein SGPRY_007426 [Prymnesium sp.]
MSDGEEDLMSRLDAMAQSQPMAAEDDLALRMATSKLRGRAKRASLKSRGIHKKERPPAPSRAKTRGGGVQAMQPEECKQ